MYLLKYLVYIVTVTISLGNRNYEEREGRKKFESKDGPVKGMSVIFHVKDLPPVERILGLAYATTRGNRLRLMPPTGPLEKWLGTRVAIHNRPPCPVTMYAGARIWNISVPGRGKTSQSFNVPEDCHSLNLFIPTKGRLNEDFQKKRKQTNKTKKPQTNDLAVLFLLVETIHIFAYYKCKTMLTLIKLHDIGI